MAEYPLQEKAGEKLKLRAARVAASQAAIDSWAAEEKARRESKDKKKKKDGKKEKKKKRKQNQKEAAEDEKEEKGKEEEAKQKEEKGKQKGRDEPSQKCTMVRPGARHAQARRREAREARARRREDAKARRREGAKARRREGAKGRSRATQVACNNYNGVKQARSKTQSKARQAVAKQKQVFLNGFRKSCETYSCDHPALWSTGAYRCATRRSARPLPGGFIYDRS